MSIYEIIAENEDFMIKAAKDNAGSIIIKKRSGYYSYLSSYDTGVFLRAIENKSEFPRLIETLRFLNPLHERDVKVN